jgi:hypothetical protein
MPLASFVEACFLFTQNKMHKHDNVVLDFPIVQAIQKDWRNRLTESSQV